MKKVVFAIALVLVALSFNSCTDSSLEELENERNNTQLIDKETTVNPNGGGQGGDDDNEEG